MQVAALQQRPALAARQQVQQPQRSGARSAVPPRPLAASASSSLGSSLARSTGSRSSSSAATRLAPVCARRERDPILAPMIQQDGPNGEVRPLLLLATPLFRCQGRLLTSYTSTACSANSLAMAIKLYHTSDRAPWRNSLCAPACTPYGGWRLASLFTALRCGDSRAVPCCRATQEAVDLYGYLMRNRIIFVNQRIGDDVACRVVASLLALDSLDDQEEIKLYINCAQARLTACVLICNCYALALRVNRGPSTAASGGLVGGCCGKNRLCVGTCGQQ